MIGTFTYDRKITHDFYARPDPEQDLGRVLSDFKRKSLCFVLLHDREVCVREENTHDRHDYTIIHDRNITHVFYA